MALNSPTSITLVSVTLGFVLSLSSIRNPYGPYPSYTNVSVSLLNSTGFLRDSTTASLPALHPNILGPASGYVTLNQSTASILTGLRPIFSTAGFVPIDGTLTLVLPAGFALTAGSTVAINQSGFGNGVALYVSAVQSASNTIVLNVGQVLRRSPYTSNQHRNTGKNGRATETD